MDLSLTQAAMVFGAGFLSVLSPCVLPVIPLIVTGTERDSPLRPLAIVAGLSVTFVAMGIATTLFASLLAGRMRAVEVAVGGAVALFGLLLIFDINPFGKGTAFGRLQTRLTGSVGGLVLGLLMGVVWIPCVGPILSGVLATVAARGSVGVGVVMLAIYSVGFGLPLLAAAYGSRFFRSRTAAVRRHPALVRAVSGALLILLGLHLAVAG